MTVEPLATAFEEAGQRLEMAKSSGKDCIWLLGRTLEWKQVGDSSDTKDTMARMVSEFNCPPQFLYELVGKERHRCVWTNPQANGADERLPLLSDRERQRLIEGPKQPMMVSDKGANKHSNRRSDSRRGAPADSPDHSNPKDTAPSGPLALARHEAKA